MKRFPVVFVPLCILILTMSLCVPAAFSQAPPSLREGIRQYQADNYEEAVELFKKAREEAPQSTEAAFFLGMAYKQVQDYPNAAIHLRDAITLSPPVKEALVELIDVLYQTNKLDEAKKWIALAEKDGIFPARISFLKGMIFSKENNNQAAIAAFEAAKQFDPSLAQAADFQIGICFIKDSKLDMAKARFQAAISHDPLSDLASFARQYQDMVEDKLYEERPLRLTLGIFTG